MNVDDELFPMVLFFGLILGIFALIATGFFWFEQVPCIEGGCAEFNPLILDGLTWAIIFIIILEVSFIILVRIYPKQKKESLWSYTLKNKGEALAITITSFILIPMIYYIIKAIPFIAKFIWKAIPEVVMVLGVIAGVALVFILYILINMALVKLFGKVKVSRKRKVKK